ncbi:MAG: efflux RND transporter permease subunit [Armatimonadetes bacterium]|nr:efflux RND transporter permease subunit [Armatimonadota bacterium]
MNIAAFSVTRPVAVTMRILALVLLGAVCYLRLPVDLLPNVSIPTVVVTTNWPNVAPEEIETQITRPLERAVSSVPGLAEVSSTTDEGVSRVRVQFQWGVDVGQGAVDILQQVERAKRSFPVDPTLENPIVTKYDPSQTPILVYGVSGISDTIRLRTLLDNDIAPVLESANGVAAVTVTGGEERAVLVEVDPEALRARNLSLQQISDAIGRENLNVPGGIARTSNTELTIRSLGLFASPDEIGAVPVVNVRGQAVRVRDVATVRDAAAETRIYTRLNGEPAVGLSIVRQSGANTLSTVKDVLVKLETVKKQYPELKFGLAYDQSRFIGQSVSRVQEDGVIGATLAVVILLFFLRNVRSTLVVALSIPISIISTFALIYLCGFTLNTMSLAGLALAVGLIVDDAVVVLENIFRHMERDKKRAAEAAVSGTQEILSAVVASTVTIIIVFLPLLLIRGQAGQMFTQLALVVIFSIAVSLLDAVTVVPMLASRFIESKAYQGGQDEALKNDKSLLGRFFRFAGAKFDALDTSYHRGLQWALKHRWQVVGGAFGITGASCFLIPLIGTELMPQTDSGDLQLRLKLPIGTSLATTDAVMKQAEKILADNPNVETVFSAAGTNLSIRGVGATLDPNQGAAIVKLKPERKSSTQDVIGELRKKLSAIPGANPNITPIDLVTQTLTGGNQNIEVVIFGESLEELAKQSKVVQEKLRDVRGLQNVDVNWQDATPELQWRVDRDKATSLGLSFRNVAGTINAATNGNIASYYQENGYQYPILVQLPESRRKTVEDLLSLPLRPDLLAGNNGVLTGNLAGVAPPPNIELRQIARASRETGPSEITRLNRQRYIAVTGTPEGRSESEIQDEITQRMGSVKLPDGYRWDFGSAQKRRAEEFAGMGTAVFLAIALIYMVLASQFESFIHPFTILLSVPLAITGVIIALFLSGRAFGLTAFIGVLLLVGIVVKNGILLIDYTNQLRERGRTRDEAVLEASPTRLRPILMTSLAAGFGMVPLALGLGEGSETQAPLATAVVGGLTTSTVLTLFVVPVVYTLFDDLARKLRGGKDADKDLARPPAIIEPSVESVEREPQYAGKSGASEYAEPLPKGEPVERR